MPHGVVCRPIEDADIEAVVDCLQRGFPERPRRYWEQGLARMARRVPVEGYPRYGHALVAAGRIVGVLLQIYSRRDAAAGSGVMCNLSSWCVDKEHRGHASLLHLACVKRKEVTYVNISPAEHTWRAIEAFGFRRFSDGRMIALPLLSAPRRGARAAPFAADAPEAALLSPNERQILGEHAAIGCLAIVCVHEGRAYPFVFQRRAILRGLIPCAQLVYCRDLGEFVRFAHVVGRRLMARSGPFCLVDARAHVPGLVGRFFAARIPKYFKGPVAPSLGDLAYTELVILGP
jgi:hypothetical protein